MKTAKDISEDSGQYLVNFEIARENAPYPPTFSAITLTRNVEGGEDHD